MLGGFRKMDGGRRVIVVWIWVLSQMQAPWWVIAVLITVYSLKILFGILKFVAEWGDTR